LTQLETTPVCSSGASQRSMHDLALFRFLLRNIPHLKHEHGALSLHTLRIERKLAIRRHRRSSWRTLIRHTKEQNGFLSTQLKDAQDAVVFYSQALKDATVTMPLLMLPWTGCLTKSCCMHQELRNFERDPELSRSNIEASLQFYRLFAAAIAHILGCR